MDCHNYKECKSHNGIKLSHCEDCTFKYQIGDQVVKVGGATTSKAR